LLTSSNSKLRTKIILALKFPVRNMDYQQLEQKIGVYSLPHFAQNHPLHMGQ
jgi:hypothetical protein